MSKGGIRVARISGLSLISGKMHDEPSPRHGLTSLDYGKYTVKTLCNELHESVGFAYHRGIDNSLPVYLEHISMRS